MSPFYAQPSPAQSNTSLSDGEDDDNNIFASGELAIASPAIWYSRLHHVQTTARTPPHSPASHLPPEILINILKHLYSPRDIHSTLFVSRSWCECSVELLWHKPSVPDVNTLIKIMQVLSREEPTFTYAQFIRRLNFISVGSEMSDNIFSRLAPCTRLERLTLVGCSNLSDDIIARTVPSFPNLVAIDLSGVDSITDRTVFALADNCHKLQGINLLGCRRVSSAGITALANKCPLLRRVKLSGLADLTDEPISQLAIKSSLLLEIDLNGCKKISDHAVRDIWAHSHNMREMRLSQCVELTDLAFPAPQNIRDGPQGLNPFPDSTRLITPDIPPLRLSRPLEHLRMLDLTNCSKITDEAVEGIVSASPRLRNLMLSKCSQLTDRAIESICLLGKHLHYLHLGHAISITDRSVKTLARSCTRLRYIDLANCNQLTDMSVFELASLPKLRRIGLVRVSNLTDEAIYSLGDRHQTLERVHLSYCDQITVMAVHYLLQKLQKLNHLSLTGIPAFRRPELQQFCRTPPAEFNTTQRSQFCVFAGEGVNKLRRFLTDLFNSITEEMNPQGEDVGDSVSYVHDDDSMDIDEDITPQMTAPPPLHPQRHTSPPAVPEPQTTRFAPRVNGYPHNHTVPYQQVIHLRSPVVHDADATAHPTALRRIVSPNRSPNRSPPPPVNTHPGPLRSNPAGGYPTSPAASEGSSAGAFFRTYQSASAPDDRPDVRKAHNSGRNHLANVRDYYASLGHDKAQSIIDQITSAYESGGPPPGGFGFGPQHLQPAGPGFGPPPGYGAGFTPGPPGFGRPPFPPGGFPPGGPPFPPPGMGPPPPGFQGMPPPPFPPGAPPFPPNGAPPGGPPFPPPNFGGSGGPPPPNLGGPPPSGNSGPPAGGPPPTNGQPSQPPGPGGMHPDRLRMMGR
ncbi:hypothetical protein BC834DRAFT_1040386 [Gloeopeniophorella convolvens]|nr:hypothetical protein BC834DRAFT_1040386 [Gloeopeniophorella convolvens]